MQLENGSVAGSSSLHNVSAADVRVLVAAIVRHGPGQFYFVHNCVSDSLENQICSVHATFSTIRNHTVCFNVDCAGIHPSGVDQKSIQAGDQTKIARIVLLAQEHLPHLGGHSIQDSADHRIHFNAVRSDLCNIVLAGRTKHHRSSSVAECNVITVSNH